MGDRPLAGHALALTRDHEEDEALFAPLVPLGARLVALPLTHQVPAPDAPRLAERLAQGAFTDLVVTSVNGVRALAAACADAALDPREALATARTWAVGPATARALEAITGRPADLVPVEATGEALAALAAGVGVAGARFLFPAAAEARRAVPEGLARAGAAVDELAVYATVPDPDLAARLARACAEGLTLAVVASPSAAAALADALDAAGLPRTRLGLAVIGPTTRAAALALGLPVLVMPTRYTLPDLAQAIAEAARAGALPLPAAAR